MSQKSERTLYSPSGGNAQRIAEAAARSIERTFDLVDIPRFCSLLEPAGHARVVQPVTSVRPRVGSGLAHLTVRYAARPRHA